MIRTYLEHAAGPEIHLLENGLNLVGRGPKVEVQAQAAGVSRTHCAIYVDPEGRVMLTDLESKNGTFLDEERVEETREVKSGQVIKVSGIRFVVGQVDLEGGLGQRPLVLPSLVLAALAREIRQSA